MADDINPALRAELIAAQEVLAPQIRGLHDLTGVSIGADLLADVNEQITDRQRRYDLIQALLNELDASVNARTALEADGYPNLPQTPLNITEFAELQGEKSDLEIAIGVFTTDPATSISVSLGTPTEKPPQSTRERVK